MEKAISFFMTRGLDWDMNLSRVEEIAVTVQGISLREMKLNHVRQEDTNEEHIGLCSSNVFLMWFLYLNLYLYLDLNLRLWPLITYRRRRLFLQLNALRLQ